MDWNLLFTWVFIGKEYSSPPWILKYMNLYPVSAGGQMKKTKHLLTLGLLFSISQEFWGWTYSWGFLKCFEMMVTHLWNPWYITEEKGRHDLVLCPVFSGAILWKWKGLLLLNRRCSSGLWLWERECLNSNFLSVSSCNHNYQALVPLIPVPCLTSVQSSEIPNTLVWICVSSLLWEFCFFFF